MEVLNQANETLLEFTFEHRAEAEMAPEVPVPLQQTARASVILVKFRAGSDSTGPSAPPESQVCPSDTEVQLLVCSDVFAPSDASKNFSTAQNFLTIWENGQWMQGAERQI